MDRTTPGTPLLLLDVDGVLSPLAPSEAWPDFRLVDDAPYWLLVSQQMADSLADLAAARAWLTSWDHLANDWLAPAFGWDPLPVVEWPEGPGPRPHSMKVEGLRAWLDEHPLPPAIVWCEDQLARPDMRADAERLLADVPHLLVAPTSAVGLEPGHVDTMRRFLAEAGHT